MNNLKRIRITKEKISQFELSRRSGVHPSRISLLESDRITPTAMEVIRIAKALGMLPEEIFGPGARLKRLSVSRRRGPEEVHDQY